MATSRSKERRETAEGKRKWGFEPPVTVGEGGDHLRSPCKEAPRSQRWKKESRAGRNEQGTKFLEAAATKKGRRRDSRDGGAPCGEAGSSSRPRARRRWSPTQAMGTEQLPFFFLFLFVSVFFLFFYSVFLSFLSLFFSLFY